MLSGLFAAAAGMDAQETRLDAVTNDIANVSTTGYQAQRVGFRDLLYSTAGPAASGTSLATGAGAAAQIMGRSQEQGAVNDTGRPLDVAIEGEGYILLRRTDGTLGLTRNGALQLDANGRLLTSSGMALEPPVTLPPGTTAADVTIGPDGTVTAGRRALGRISLVTVPAPDRLIADGDSTFSPTAASGGPRAATGATLRQGALEASNVDLASAMTDLMDAQQGYSLASKAIQFQDQMLEIADGVKR